MADFNKMTEALVECDATKLTDLVNEALAANIPASDIKVVDLALNAEFQNVFVQRLGFPKK
jgi:hypothetical protein